MTEAAAPAPRKGGKKIIVLGAAALLVLAGGGAGAFFFLHRKPPTMGQQVAAAAGRAPPPPVFADVPELIANLAGSPRHQSYVKLKARIELARPQDQAILAAAMPRIQDLFQTYLREMRPDELQGSAGTYRLREELIARANIAVAPAQVTDVLFTDLLVQ